MNLVSKTPGLGTELGTGFGLLTLLSTEFDIALGTAQGDIEWRKQCRQLLLLCLVTSLYYWLRNQLS